MHHKVVYVRDPAVCFCLFSNTCGNMLLGHCQYELIQCKLTMDGDTKSSLNKHQLEHIRVAFISVCYAVHYSTSDTLMLLVKVHMLCLMKVVDTHVLLMSNNVMHSIINDF